MNALVLALVVAASPARPTRLAKCQSGKTGVVQLYVQRAEDGTWALTSKDPADAEARAFTGKVRSATHAKLDKQHHAYRFVLQDGELTQAAGLDPAHCKADGQAEHCPVSTLVVKLSRGGPHEPGDDGISALQGDDGIAMDNGGPQGCVVYASKALKALLAAGR